MNGSKSKRYCSVPGCSTYVSKDVSLHFFPKSDRLKEEWAHVLNLEKVTKFMSVCSKHFVQSDFISTTNCIRRRLKKNAVPSQNLSHELIASKGNAIQKRTTSKKISQITECVSVSSNKDEGVIAVNVLDEIEKMYPKIDIRSLFDKTICGKIDTNICKKT